MSVEVLTCPQCGRTFEPPSDRCPIDGAPLFGPEVLARVGQELGNYRVLGILGEGGMGVVYKGEHVMLDRPVALKVLHDRFARRKGAATQFLREARAASRIRHPNIVDVTDFGKAPDGSIFFVMEYLEGESLEDVLARDTRLPVFDAVNIVNQIARALAAAHEHGIVHQDLKPDNIFLINQEGRRRIVRRVHEDAGDQFVVEHEGRFNFVKLLDFGVAKFNEDNLGPGLTAKTGMVFGTPHYMSPEQAQGLPVDARSDIYSLGILFYEMILGVVPFDSESALEILNGHVSGHVVPPKDYDPSVSFDEATNTTVLRCLEKEPDQRFQSMDELCVALRNCFTDRVFLRDAHMLPGAVESGIVPPTAPARPPAEQFVPSDERPEARGGRRRRLTEDLAELFTTGEVRLMKQAQQGGSQPSDDGSNAAASSADQPLALQPKPKARPRPRVPARAAAGAAPAVTRDLLARSAPPVATPRAATPELQPLAMGRCKTDPGLGGVFTSPRPEADPDGEPRKRKITEPLSAKFKG